MRVEVFVVVGLSLGQLAAGLGCRPHREPVLLPPSGHGPCCPVPDPTTWDRAPEMFRHSEPEFRSKAHGTEVSCRLGMRFRLIDAGYVDAARILVTEWLEEHTDLYRADFDVRFAGEQPLGDLTPGDPIGRVVWLAEGDLGDGQPYGWDTDQGRYWFIASEGDARKPPSP